MNEKGGMNEADLEKYVMAAILPLYPDAADVPGRRVLIKVDSGPGRMNTQMLARLRIRGVYFVPGVPNSTHVTQETDQNYGLFKSIYRKNLDVLTQHCFRMNQTLSIAHSVFCIFGGNEEGWVLDNAFAKAFSKRRNLACWKKCGAVPLTRACLDDNKV